MSDLNLSHFQLERPNPLACSPAVLVAAASTFVGVDDEPYRRGQLVRFLLNRASLPADAPWGTAFVSHVGLTSHQYGGTGRSAWPMPAIGIAEDVAAFARERGIARDEPEPGDVALFWSHRERGYYTAGIVVAMALLDAGAGGRPIQMKITTIEGNVTPSGRGGGHGIYRVKHRISASDKTMFVRWTALDPRGAESEPERLPEREMGQTVVRRSA